MTPPYKLERVVPYGRTDNSGDDTLWGMFISEPGREAEKVLATWAQTYGVPSELDVEAALARRASHFNENESALDQKTRARWTSFACARRRTRRTTRLVGRSSFCPRRPKRADAHRGLTCRRGGGVTLRQ